MGVPTAFSRVVTLASVAALVTACGGGSTATPSSSPTTAPAATSGSAVGTSASTAQATASTRLPEKTSVSFAVAPGAIPTILPIVAQEFGFFADENLDFKIVTIPASTTSVQALASGSLDLTYLDPVLIATARKQGLDIRAVAGNYRVQNTLICQRDMNVTGTYPSNVKALSGRTVGLTVSGTGLEYYLRYTLMQAGVDASTVKIVPLGAVANQVAAFKARQIDCDVAFPPLQDLLSDQSTALVDWAKGEGPNELTDAIGSVYVTSMTYASAHPDRVKAVSHALQRAIQFARDPNNATQLATKLGSGFQGMDNAVLVAALKRAASSWGYGVPEKTLNNSIAVYEKVTGTKLTLPYSDYLAPTMQSLLASTN